MKINWEGNSKAWDFLIIILTNIPIWLVTQCNEDANEAWKSLIEKYEVSDDKQEGLNEIKNWWNNCRIEGTSQDPDIWFNELFNLNLKFKKIN